MKRSIIMFLLGFSIITSCKKEENYIEESKTKLPNFGNVNLDKVFSEKESRLSNADSIIPYINNYYQKVWEKGDLSGSFLVAKGDRIISEKYRGFARENGTAINANTALHVASVSKTMTAMAVLKLADAEKIDINDPVTKFFPQFPYKKVTVFHLLSQRSGLPKYENFIETITPQPEELSKPYLSNKDILNLMIKYKPDLARETNTGFMYCNTNYALLALIVEKVTGVSFPQAMKEMVFAPLKMKNSFIFREKDIPSAAQSFYNRGNRLYPLDRLDLIYGDKNVYTTPRDLLNFSKALYSKNFVKSDLKKMIFQPYSNEKKGINNYGLGFRMKIFDNGEKLTYHNGWWHGTNSVFAHLLKSDVTIIAIGNKYSNRVYTALALSGLFEDFPLEKSRLSKIMNDTGLEKDSATDNANGE
ncbi:serine hydrolase domain-containing protein [Amniculibacterium aquaticum]|uniref:serine hydrolase domain-containing protein n=1 Tax=Amniculibacterium aquaticum TaxID=2479858 RepID=UPI000F59839A|nr:serine hydrolase domain-containing protein [Amniculibacterium aquaticum]